MFLKNVRPERTGWRDEAISRRHRTWGFDCPAVDIDFLVTEYHKGRAVAICEYKEYHARTPDLLHPSYHALRDLCDGYRTTPLPFFIARYWSDIWAFCVTPGNRCATNHFFEHELLTELQFVGRLYYLRGLALPDSLLETLNTTLPKIEQ